MLPVTIDNLKSSGIGKTINKLQSTNSDPTLAGEIKKLIDKWTRLVKEKKEDKGVFGSLAQEEEKPKPSLPSFKKKEVAPPVEEKHPKKREIEKISTEDPVDTQPKKIKTKKKLTWAPEDKLCQIKEYIVEVTIPLVHAGSNASKMDREYEKNVRTKERDGKMNKFASMAAQAPWITPAENGWEISRGYDSNEVHIQDKRSSSIEPSIYQSKYGIPESPGSPSGEGDILSSLVSNPDLLTQLLSSIQPTTTVEPIQQIPTFSNPYSLNQPVQLPIHLPVQPQPVQQPTMPNLSFLSTLETILQQTKQVPVSVPVYAPPPQVLDMRQSNPYATNIPYSRPPQFDPIPRNQGYPPPRNEIRNEPRNDMNRVRHPLEKTQQCKFFPLGKCKLGNACPYLHGDH
jgi:hypothetical protein